MLGSTLSISGPNLVLNTIVAESLSQFADELEGAEDFNASLKTLIKRTIKEHKRIIFNGNNYSDEWVAEAKKRGLLNLKSTVEALPMFISEKNVALFTRHKIFTQAEIMSRYEILLENYSKTINIEAETMLDMAKRNILPAVVSYIEDLSKCAVTKASISASIDCSAEKAMIEKLSALLAQFYEKIGRLETVLTQAQGIADALGSAVSYHDGVIAAMDELRSIGDELETLTASKYWPYPCYSEMLFGV